MTEAPDRRRRAARAAYLAGALLILTGGTGAVALVRVGWRTLNSLTPDVGPLLAPLFLAAWIVAVLGGFSVLAGAYVLERHSRLLGKTLIGLGAGVGLLTFGLYLFVFLVSGGNVVRLFMTAGLSLQGIGILLALYAQARG